MAYTTIKITGDPVQGEFIVEADLYPGHIVELTSAAADTVKKHTVSGGISLGAVVFEDELQGKGIRDMIPTGDRAQVMFMRPGEEFLGRVKDTLVVTKGAYVCSAGGGEVKAVTVPDTEHPFAVAMETVDMSGSAGVDPEGFIRLKRI